LIDSRFPRESAEVLTPVLCSPNHFAAQQACFACVLDVGMPDDLQPAAGRPVAAPRCAKQRCDKAMDAGGLVAVRTGSA
jgi:hypothetical protein